MDTNRRDFIKGAATAVAALPTFNILSEEYSHTLGPDADPINVGLIGYGAMGEVLLCAAMKIPGVRIRAVCDIWENNRKKAKSFTRGMRHTDCAF
jgi:predicted homoserine dehydrogenase-like protein